MAGERAKLLCSFGGGFVSQPDRAYYVGGKTRLASIDRSATFTSLLSKMSELCGADPDSLDIRFQLTDGSLDFRLISVETDDDVRNMMEEFDTGRKIPIFLFTGTAAENGVAPAIEATAMDTVRETAIVAAEEPEFVERNSNETPIVAAEEPEFVERNSNETPIVAAEEPQFLERNTREMPIVTAEELIECQSSPSNFAMSSRKDYITHPTVSPSMSGEMFQRDSRSLVVGQEYEDVHAFRIALTGAAVAGNFEIHVIRSSPKRLTARCAAEGCTWRVHAAKFAHDSGFRIRTLTTDHTCVRSEAAGARQAKSSWVAKCIRDKLRQNCNYKPKEIIDDIHREYGVLITYKKAYYGREKALEELRAEPAMDTVPVEDLESTHEENQAESLACGEIHDPPRKAPRPEYVRRMRCTRCNEIGHNKRTCFVPKPYLGRDFGHLLAFWCRGILVMQDGHLSLPSSTAFTIRLHTTGDGIR